MSRFYFTPMSRNQKTGGMPVTTSPQETCPESCPLKRSGCYAESGPLAILWRGLDKNPLALSYDELLEKIRKLKRRTLWRANQAGDLIGKGGIIDAPALSALVKANAGKRGFTYTHFSALIPANADAIRKANESGFTINLSADNPAQADKLAETGAGPVVTVLPDSVKGPALLRTPAGRAIAVCPATYADVTCADCQICAISSRKAIIGFPSHGPAKRKASAIAAQ